VSSLLYSTCSRELIYALRRCLHRVWTACLCIIGIAVLGGGLALAEQGDAPARGLSGSDDELLGMLTRRIAGLTPDKIIETELLPGEIRLLGCDVPDVGLSKLKQSSHFGLTLYFECLPGIRSPFEREIVVSLGEIDIARTPFRAGNVQPGEVVKCNVRLYVPRNAPIGDAELRGGFVRDGAPGESKRDLAERMSPLLTVKIQAADPLPGLTPQQKSALLKTAHAREPRNLLANGRFEEGLRGWKVGEDILEGKQGWGRILHVSVDKEVVLEGLMSLRLDFGGGHDINFWHIGQRLQVKADTKYMLSYFIKTENVTSQQGPSLSIDDPDTSSEKLYLGTPRELRLTGTNDWTYVEIPFETTPSTRTVRVRLRRMGSGAKTYDPSKYGPISGTVWFDFIQLTERQ